MIVNAVKEGWKIIFQRNHALLAGAIAMRLRPEFRPPHWPETLCAIMEHDDGQVKWNDREHLTQSGRPIDFTMNEFDAKQAEQVVTEAIYKSRWIALLTSMHTTSLYTPAAGSNRQAAEFIDRQKQLQQQLREALQVSQRDMERHYRFMRWCDECSLILCQDRLHNDGQRIEVGALSGEEPNFICRRGQHVTVDPWCFATDSFTVDAEFQLLRQLVFASTEEFKNCLDISKRELQSWHFQK